jgi:hypothetical protein
MPCDRDGAGRRLISYLEKVMPELLDREQHHGWDEHRARELVRQWLAPRGKAVRQ